MSRNPGQEKAGPEAPDKIFQKASKKNKTTMGVPTALPKR